MLVGTGPVPAGVVLVGTGEVDRVVSGELRLCAAMAAAPAPAPAAAPRAALRPAWDSLPVRGAVSCIEAGETECDDWALGASLPPNFSYGATARGLDLDVFFLRRQQRKPRMAAIRSTPTTTPTTMPAIAPPDRPLEPPDLFAEPAPAVLEPEGLVLPDVEEPLIPGQTDEADEQQLSPDPVPWQYSQRPVVQSPKPQFASFDDPSTHVADELEGALHHFFHVSAWPDREPLPHQ